MQVEEWAERADEPSHYREGMWIVCNIDHRYDCTAYLSFLTWPQLFEYQEKFGHNQMEYFDK